MMKKNLKRGLSVLCAVAMGITMVPQIAFADEIQEPEKQTEMQETQDVQENSEVIETVPAETENEIYESEQGAEVPETDDVKSQEIQEAQPLAIEKNKIDITADNSQRYFTVSVQNISVEDVKDISIAVWSRKNGQDDLRWYPATQQKDGSWQLTVDVKNHKSDTGVYNAHVYVNTKHHTSQIIGGKTFNVEGIRRGNVSVKTINKDAGTYRIEVSGDLTPSTVSKVVIPIWSAKDGQDDIVWYEASKSGDVWCVDLDISNHKYDAGTYYAHAYVTDDRGVESFSNGITFSASEVKKNMLDVQVNNSQTEAKVTLKNFTASADNVLFPVWGNVNGQNDIIWYPATKVDAHTYTANVKISNHKETGSYAVHAYYMKGGNLQYINASSFDVPKMGNADLNVKHQDEGRGLFDVEVSNLKSPATIKSVSIAVWSNVNGQDDLRWYAATNKNGVWCTNVDVMNHKLNTGAYNVHVYAEDMRGISQLVAAKTITVSDITAKPSVSASVNEDTGKVQITVSDMFNASRVQIPVWGNVNGQNDLVWYEASKKDARTWTVTADLGNHMETGSYNAHVYATINGQFTFTCSTTFNINKISSNIVNVYDKSDHMGLFSVKIQNVANAANVRNVKMAVWSERNGQDDLRWENAQRDGNAWYVNVNSADHFYESGKYNVHVYAEYADGQFKFLGATSADVHVNADVAGLVNGVVASSWIAYDYNTGEILYSKNPDSQVYLASQTKLMVALLVLENVSDLNTPVTMNWQAKSGMSWDTTMAGLVVGKQYTVRTLLEGMLVYSGADCANLLAQCVGGTTTHFVSMMNARAAQLGMKNTHFADPVGLYANYSTPREYAKLATAALARPEVRQIVGMRSVVLTATDGTSGYRLSNSNGLINGSVAYNTNLYTVDGGKTGTTDQAGYCLTSMAHNRQNRTVIAAVFNSNSHRQRAVDVRTLFDYTFTH